MAVDDGCERLNQVAVWFDFVQLAGLDERREHGLVLCISVATCEERVFALWGDGAMGRIVRLAASLSILIDTSENHLN
jgi:hypothetical protein